MSTLVRPRAGEASQERKEKRAEQKGGLVPAKKRPGLCKCCEGRPSGAVDADWGCWVADLTLRSARCFCLQIGLQKGARGFEHAISSAARSGKITHVLDGGAAGSASDGAHGKEHSVPFISFPPFFFGCARIAGELRTPTTIACQTASQSYRSSLGTVWAVETP